MFSVSKTKFKNDCQKLFSEVEKKGEDLMVTDTDNNLPLVIIQPLNNGPEIEDVFADIQDQINYSHNFCE